MTKPHARVLRAKHSWHEGRRLPLMLPAGSRVSGKQVSNVQLLYKGSRCRALEPWTQVTSDADTYSCSNLYPITSRLYISIGIRKIKLYLYRVLRHFKYRYEQGFSVEHSLFPCWNTCPSLCARSRRSLLLRPALPYSRRYATKSVRASAAYACTAV